jgi:hypothetical protein
MPFGLSPIELIAQIIGIVYMAIHIGSFQFKDVKKFYIAQVTVALLTMLHYLLLGGYSGMAMQIVGLARCLCLQSENRKLHSKWVMGAILLFNAVLGIVTFSAPLDLLPTVAQTIGTVALWSENATVIHLVQLLILSPAFGSYGALVGSLSGVLTEVFSVCSILIYFGRELAKKRGEQKKG